jgi:hypothetical protein
VAKKKSTRKKPTATKKSAKTKKSKRAASKPSRRTKAKSAKKKAARQAPAKPRGKAKKLTLAHVTHEAVEQLGGIGAVLEGLMMSPVYQQRVGRSILIGPTSTGMAVDPKTRLGEHGTVLYSSVDGIDKVGLKEKFQLVEWAFNVAIVYGKRTYHRPGEDRSGEAEVLLIDVFRPNVDRLGVFKLRLWEMFGLDSSRYEHAWDYEEYVRLAEPAFHALRALLDDQDLPCVLFAHEYMGMPAALAAILDGGDRFRTVFHAHECSTARHIVEHHPGHDTMFYNVLEQARAHGKFVEDEFPGVDHHLRHALVSRAHLCDAVIAVGDHTADELRFLNAKFSRKTIDTAYNGLPAMKVTAAAKQRSRKMLLDYAEQLLGYRPDVLLTHVTRPVISKALWRDMKLCHELDQRLAAEGKTAAHFILTSGGGTRRPQDVAAMEAEYGWPRHHRHGYPDLVGPEVEIHAMIEPFNAEHQHCQIVLVNQFGWERSRIGQRLPAKMDIADLRRAADVEIGTACYEPFGISPLEPLGAGAICLISNVCGCENFVRHVTAGKPTPNVLTADYTRLPYEMSTDQLKAMHAEHRDRIEEAECARVADELMQRLPFDDKARTQLIKSGQALVKKMGWDQVCSESLLPMLDRICASPTQRG